MIFFDIRYIFINIRDIINVVFLRLHKEHTWEQIQAINHAIIGFHFLNIRPEVLSDLSSRKT